MDNEEHFHEQAEQILKENKSELSVTEMSILIQSQYYNIEKLFTYSAEVITNDTLHDIEVLEKLIGMCDAHIRNKKLIPEGIGWKDDNNQSERVSGIKAESLLSLKLKKLTKSYEDNPSVEKKQKIKDYIDSIRSDN